MNISLTGFTPGDTQMDWNEARTGQLMRRWLQVFPTRKAIGADVMRVVGSSLMFRHEPHGPQIKALVKMFKKAVKVAKDHGVKLAVENHIDFTSDEILQLLDRSGF